LSLDELAASFYRQVAACFCYFYLAKKYKIGIISTTTKARDKMVDYIETE
jgi:hypothetical protein